jgi:hypothetical protein
MAIGGVVGLTPAPAQAACQVDTFGLELFETFQCDRNAGWFLINNNSLASVKCHNLALITDAAHPAPNGWSNRISSADNSVGTRAAGFYDSLNCTGPVLFAMDAGSTRASLVAAANNKASSIRIVDREDW